MRGSPITQVLLNKTRSLFSVNQTHYQPLKPMNSLFNTKTPPAYPGAKRILDTLMVFCLALSPGLIQAATPPNPTVEMRFSEGPTDAGGQGVTTTNSGT